MTTPSFPVVELSPLPPNTVVPQDELLFIPYLNRLYEDIAFAANERDHSAFTISIGSTAVSLTNVPNYGAFLVMVGGFSSIATDLGDTQPTITASLCKSTSTNAGQVVVLGSQVGSGAWAGINLTITSTAQNFQIAHNNAGVLADFNLRVVGTQ